MHDIPAVKELLGIVSQAETSSEAGTVLVDWENAIDRIGREQGLSVESRSLSFVERGIPNRYWRLKSGVGAELQFEVFFTPRYAQAVDYLAELATQTTMMTIPYKKSPEQIGNLAVVTKFEPATRLMWVYRNVAMELCLLEGKHDLFTVAKLIQQQIEPHVVKAVELFPPQVKGIGTTGRLQTKVGETVTLEIVTAPSNRKYRLDAFILGEQASLGLMDQNTIKVNAKSPGTVKVIVAIADQQYLLCASREIILEILPVER